MKQKAHELVLYKVLNGTSKLIFVGNFYIILSILLGLTLSFVNDQSTIESFISFVTNILLLWLLGNFIWTIVFTISEGDVETKYIARVLKSFILWFFFMAGYSYGKHNTVSDGLLLKILIGLAISGSVALIARYVLTKVFNRFLFDKVLNKEYLGLRQITDDKIPEVNIFKDLKETDVDKRMHLINSHAVKEPYQGIVELYTLDREIHTGVKYSHDVYGTRITNGKAHHLSKRVSKTFTEEDEIIHPEFKIKLHGDEKLPFCTLVKFSISKRQALTKVAHLDDIKKVSLEGDSL